MSTTFAGNISTNNLQLQQDLPGRTCFPGLGTCATALAVQLRQSLPCVAVGAQPLPTVQCAAPCSTVLRATRATLWHEVTLRAESTHDVTLSVSPIKMRGYSGPAVYHMQGATTVTVYTWRTAPLSHSSNGAFMQYCGAQILGHCTD